MKIFKAAAAAVLALALLIQMPARAYAQTQNADTKDYISEVKIATGSDAEKALEGYTILSDENGKAVDLNKDAGIREEPEFRLHHRLAHLCVLRDAVSFPGLQQEDEPVDDLSGDGLLRFHHPSGLWRKRPGTV